MRRFFSSPTAVVGSTLAAPARRGEVITDVRILGSRLTVAAAGPDAAQQLNALIEADFDLKVFTQARLSAWCAFWGEAQSRPLYQASCGEKDEDYNRTMEEICQRLIDEGGYSGSAVRLARIVRVTIEGVWLDRMTMAAPYSPDEALATVRLCAARCFPAHFSDTGPR